MNLYMIITCASVLNAAEIPVESNDEALALALALAFEDWDLSDSQSNLSQFIGPFIAPQDVEKMAVISDNLRKVFKPNGGVHAGDHCIPQHIPTILGIGRKLVEQCGTDISEVSHKNLIQISENLLLITSLYGDVLSEYHYEKTPKSLSSIQEIIKTQFLRSSKEVGRYASGQGTQVWAMTIALALNLLNDPNVKDEEKHTIVHHLVDQSIEGMLTQGGCIQGFANRGFIALMNILAYYSRSI